MTRRAERKAENRAKLLAAARKVFAETGLAGATARDIVRETDLATGTFYNYFEDKEDAFRAVMDEFTRQARVAAREERLQRGVDLEERLYRAYCAYFELAVADPQMFEFLRRNADAVAMLGPENSFDGAIRDLVEDMHEWIEAGDLPRSLEPWLPMIARSIAGGGFQMAAQLAEEGRSDITDAARFGARLLLDGLRGIE